MPKIGRNQVVSLLLGALTLGLYWKATQFQFVNYDDPDYVLNNPVVKAGLTGEGIKWAFFASYASNWHPLTWISHMLDCNLYGLNPGGHHATSVVLHAVNTVLLFWVLVGLTGGQNSKLETRNSKQIRNSNSEGVSSVECRVPAKGGSPNFWACAMVAALFGLHPMHVESVAWVAERKDVLSTLFFLLTIGAWGRYVRKFETRNSKLETSSKSEIRTGEERNHGWTRMDTDEGHKKAQKDTKKISRITHHASRITHHASFFYRLSIVFFALGLMSKPMLVTTPFVLLLLDFWPLGRVSGVRCQEMPPNSQIPKLQNSKTPFLRLVLEKIPFFALSAFGCVATVWAQRAHGMSDLQAVPFSGRFGNALTGYARYLWKMIWPHDLAVLYPFREWTVWQIAGAGALLLVISFFVWRERSRRPYLMVGWLWYLGTMVPVIGLVQVGIHSMADRYTYIPYIGLFVAVVWFVRDAFGETVKTVKDAGQRSDTQLKLGVNESQKDASSGPDTQLKVGVNERGSLGRLSRGPWSRGLVVLWSAVSASLLIACAVVTERQLGYWVNSVELFRHTVQVTRNNLRAEYNLGVALARAGQKEEAVEHYRKALAITPTALDVQAKTQGEAHRNLGIVYAESGDWTNAETEFRTVLNQEPNSAPSRASLAGVLIQEGRFEEAIGECQAALAINPREIQAWRWLGVAAADLGRSEEALRALREAVRLSPDGAAELNELAWFLATTADDAVRNGEEAVRLAQRACELTGWREPRCIGTLDAACAEAGRFDEAIKYAQQTREVALATGQAAVASAAEERLRLYAQGKTYRQRP